MFDKQKTETAAPAAPQEVNEEALDQIAGGKYTAWIITNGFNEDVNVVGGFNVVNPKLGDK